MCEKSHIKSNTKHTNKSVLVWFTDSQLTNLLCAVKRIEAYETSTHKHIGSAHAHARTRTQFWRAYGLHEIEQIDYNTTTLLAIGERNSVTETETANWQVYVRECMSEQGRAKKDNTMNTMANTTLEEGELEQSICSVVENASVWSSLSRRRFNTLMQQISLFLVCLFDDDYFFSFFLLFAWVFFLNSFFLRSACVFWICCCCCLFVFSLSQYIYVWNVCLCVFVYTWF